MIISVPVQDAACPARAESGDGGRVRQRPVPGSYAAPSACRSSPSVPDSPPHTSSSRPVHTADAPSRGLIGARGSADQRPVRKVVAATAADAACPAGRCGRAARPDVTQPATTIRTDPTARARGTTRFILLRRPRRATGSRDALVGWRCTPGASWARETIDAFPCDSRPCRDEIRPGLPSAYLWNSATRSNRSVAKVLGRQVSLGGCPRCQRAAHPCHVPDADHRLWSTSRWQPHAYPPLCAFWYVVSMAATACQNEHSVARVATSACCLPAEVDARLSRDGYVGPPPAR